MTSTTTTTTTSDYWVGDIIGEGSFGHVLYGRHKQSNIHVAIKCIDTYTCCMKYPYVSHHIIQEQQFLLRCYRTYQQEHASSNSDDHDDNNNIDRNNSSRTSIPSNNNNNNNKNKFVVQLLASFYDDQCIYLVMECCSNGTLQDVLNMYTKKNHHHDHHHTNHRILLVQFYGIQLIHAISFLHTQCYIIHCDIKPLNILVTSYGNIKISDFGCSIDILKQNHEQFQQSSSQCHDTNIKNVSRIQKNITRGTAAYSAPELNRSYNHNNNYTDTNHHHHHHVSISPAVDLWSLGCIIYALLHTNSQSPFDISSTFGSHDQQPQPQEQSYTEARILDTIQEFCSLYNDHDNEHAPYTFLFPNNTNIDIHSSSFSHVDTIHDNDDDDVDSLTTTTMTTISMIQKMIVGLLHPNSDERIQYAIHGPTSSSTTTTTTMKNSSTTLPTIQEQQNNQSYIYLQSCSIWDNTIDHHDHPEVLPPIPAWWVKNSTATIPTTTISISNEMTIDDNINEKGINNSTATSDIGSGRGDRSNILLDGAKGWSVFLV